MKMKISVVIPVYGNWDLVHSRLNELFHHVPLDTEIIVVDDASPDRDSIGILKWWKTESPLKDRLFIYKNEENIGFGGTCNRGAEIAIKHGAEGICLLSSDVAVLSNFVSNVETILSLDKNVLIGGEVLYNDTGWNVLPGCGVVPYANGWFIATHRDTWARLGGFDLRYSPFDYEDLDLSTTAWWEGIKIVPLGAKLRHASGKSVAHHPTARLQQTQKNRQLWIEKWSDRAEELRIKIYGKEMK